MREAERRGDARELRRRGPEVRDQQGEHRERGHLEAELLADERRQPLPVTAPMRAPISWVTARMGVMSSSSHSML